MKLFEDLCQTLPPLSDHDVDKWCTMLDRYRNHLENISSKLYEKLDAEDKQRFITWMLKRWGGIHTVNEVEYGLYLNKIKTLNNESRDDIEHNGKIYKLRDFSSQGQTFKLLGYEWFTGAHDVYYNQYEHKDCRLQKGDVIIDAGAFIGDTAVLFNHKLLGECEIHCFELLDENLSLLQYNLELNQVNTNKVTLNKLALSDKTNEVVYIKQGATQGGTSMYGQPKPADAVETITLDDYVQVMNLNRVDFIKMDIEGAEIPALNGALKTIQHFRPRLALCLYHKWDDIITIPNFLASTGLHYHFDFKWVHLANGWEAVLLATPVEAEEEASERPQGHPNSRGLSSAIHRLSKRVSQKPIATV